MSVSNKPQTPNRAVAIYFVAFWIGLTLFQTANAFEPIQDVQVHGFLSQGYFITSGNHLFGKSDSNGSLDFTNIALNATWTPLSNLRFATQGLFRRAGAGHEGDMYLDYAVMDYTAYSTDDHRLGIRLGRYKLPAGLYNDTRDVPFTRPGVILPQSMYFERTRELGLSADGGLLYAEQQTDWGNFSTEFAIGEVQSDTRDSQLAVLGRNPWLKQDWPGSLPSDPSYIGRLMYDLDGGRVRLAITGADINTRYVPKYDAPYNLLGGKVPLDLPSGRFNFQPWYFSAQYNAENWSLTAEYALRNMEFSGFGKPIDRQLAGESYYLQGTYRILPQVQGLVRYDVYYANRDDRDGSSVVGKPSYTQFAKDWTFGLRYDITPTIMLQTEYHRVHGTGWLPIQDNLDVKDPHKNWDIFAVQASFRF